ncbi:MAG: hypothetical protein LWX83_15425 [Anaerolineae bacterium]|nr:hypothetical protein [Anaerolineae bacterium]
MKNRSSNQVLQEIAREHYSGKINLLPEILSKTSTVKTGSRKSLRWFIAIPIILMFVSLALVYAPVAVEAITRLLAYLPGIGLVDQSAPMRTLPGVVQVNRVEGRITIKQALLDSQQSVLVYTVDNLFYENKPAAKHCTQLPYLRLPDGKQLSGDSSGSSWDTGYSRRVVFPAIPASINDVTMIFPCLEQSDVSLSGGSVEIPLHFVALSPRVTIYPLTDLSTPTPAVTEAAQKTPPVQSATPTANSEPVIKSGDFEMYFESYAALEDGYLLYGTLKALSPQASFVWYEDDAVHLLNAAGQEIVLSSDPLSGRKADPKRGEYPLAFKSSALAGSGPFTLRLDAIHVDQAVNDSFDFDPGPNPGAGQTWDLNREIKIAGQSLLIKSARLDAGGKNLIFVFDAHSPIQSAVFFDADLPAQEMGGGGGSGEAGLFYPNGLPGRVIHVKINLISFKLAGPWQTSLDLPTAPVAADEQSGATEKTCLTQTSWQQAAPWNVNGPAGLLTGKLALAYLSEGLAEYYVRVANFNGSDSLELGKGDTPSLSPDGSKVIFTTSDGLVLVDLKTMQKMMYNGSSRADRGVLWSPDGDRFAFTRGPASGLIGAPGPYQIWISAWNGANARALETGHTASKAQTWTPDGKAIIYTVEQQSGASVEMINIDDGQVTPLFEVNYENAGVAISPDGKKVAFEVMLPGEHYGINIANLDGSGQRLISDPYPLVATVPVWSPDGKWVVVSVHDPASSSFSPELGLIEVDTCAIFRLPQLKGYVYSWLAQ